MDEFKEFNKIWDNFLIGEKVEYGPIDPKVKRQTKGKTGVFRVKVKPKRPPTPEARRWKITNLPHLSKVTDYEYKFEISYQGMAHWEVDRKPHARIMSFFNATLSPEAADALKLWPGPGTSLKIYYSIGDPEEIEAAEHPIKGYWIRWVNGVGRGQAKTYRVDIMVPIDKEVKDRFEIMGAPSKLEWKFEVPESVNDNKPKKPTILVQKKDSCSCLMCALKSNSCSFINMFDKRWRECIEKGGYTTNRKSHRNQYATGWMIHALLDVYSKAGINSPIIVGDMSRKTPGSYGPHVSHGKGIDADLRIIKPGSGGSQLEVNSKFIKALCDSPYIEAVFVDQVKVDFFVRYFKRQGWDSYVGKRYSQQLKKTVNCLKGPNGRNKVYHWPSHRRHYHVRAIACRQLEASGLDCTRSECGKGEK